MQARETLHVALAPPGDAVAQPMFLGDDLAVELVLLLFLFLQFAVAPGLEFAEAARQMARAAAVDPDASRASDPAESGGRG